jgi:hypothetical protein
MSKRIRHRGPDPEDERLFGAGARALLREAVGDLCWLLDRGYAVASASELVGNRYALTQRQRIAGARCACPSEVREQLQARQVAAEALAGRELWIDGFNVVMILEAALGGGVVLVGRDGCLRDVSGIHRRYQKVEETAPALRLVGDVTSALKVSQCRWFLDSPIGNSGRLKTLILEQAAAGGWLWQVELVMNPDQALARCGQIVATSDRAILNRCGHWFNLTGEVVARHVPKVRRLDLSA